MVVAIGAEILWEKMVDLSGSSGTVLVKSENGGHDRVWSDEHDCVPLKQRLKLLLASKRLSGYSDADSEKGSENSSPPRIDVLAKKEDRHCDSQGSSPACCAQEGRNERLSPKQTNAGMLRKNSFQGTVVNKYVSSNGNSDTASEEKVDVSSNTLLPCSMLSNYPIKVEVDYVDNSLMNSLGDGVRGSLCNDVQAVKLRTKIADEFMHDLDHVVLKERQKLLLSRKFLELKKPVPEGNCSWFSNPAAGDTVQHTLHIEKKENHSSDAESSFSGNPSHVALERNASDFCKTSESGSPSDIIRGSSCTMLKLSPLMGSCQGIGSTKAETFVEIQGSDEISSSKKVSSVDLSCGRQEFVPGSSHSMLSSTVSLTYKNIKAEPLDYGEVRSLNQDAICNFPTNGINPVKSEREIPEESYGDEIDHMLLRDRIQLLTSRMDTHLDNSRKFECSKRMVPSVLTCTPTASESYIPIRISRPRKSRKTATDSVETALEEDAPGLLQVLIDKGVSVDEMKLYGELETDEALDDSFSEDNFSELEAVISKLFSQRQSLLKFAPLRCTKGEKASYCLACLISLVEQARYLQFRKWPVEWGWCRDLQSFVFVFERHNRIVLERPEYGYATYFFELVDALPVDWQIKRLVTAMKLTSCSRVTLIENKSLLVGEDLTEGEARVLMEYGWVPNSGLGTMLNYCDRVVHDRKNERDSSEWRSKIGKLLVDGYNSGTIVSPEIPKKVMEYNGGQGARIKLEL